MLHVRTICVLTENERLHGLPIGLYPLYAPAPSNVSSPFCDAGSSFAGPKTVFFWAPLMKWCLVAAGLKDLSRPADKLSVSQNLGAWKSCHCLLRIADVCAHIDVARSPYGRPCVLSRTTALAATGFIWVRYSLVITPINYSLAAVRI